MKSHIIHLLVLIACLYASVVVAEEIEDEWDEFEDEEDEEDFSFLCSDERELCERWASEGECESNPTFMKKACKKSCNTCFGEEGEYEPHQTPFHRGGDFGVPQQLVFGDGTREEDIQWIIGKARNYMHYVVPYKFGDGMNELCRNKHQSCAWWSLLGECTNNPTYMLEGCGPVCSSCEALTIEMKCPLDPDAPEVWEAGDLNKMFEKLTSEPYKSQYSVEVLSSPATGGPWVIQMEDVVLEKEAQRLIELGSELGYERSTDVGRPKADGTLGEKVSKGRTSTNAWCDGICEEDAYSSAVIERLTELTGIPETNSEHLQLLRYETGQKYQTHHDFISYHVKRQAGPRILTAYLYLNDVPEGGGTNFDQLDITVMPKRGRVLLWPSTLDKHPDRKDKRTTHQALPVESGVKFGANAWFHLRDFKTALEDGCM